MTLPEECYGVANRQTIAAGLKLNLRSMTSMYLLLAIGLLLADNAAMSGELDFLGQRFVVGGLVVVAVLTYSFPFVMVPMLVLAALVVAYLRHSRPKDSL